MGERHTENGRGIEKDREREREILEKCERKHHKMMKRKRRKGDEKRRGKERERGRKTY